MLKFSFIRRIKIVMKDSTQIHCIVFSRPAQSLALCAPLTKMAKETQILFFSRLKLISGETTIGRNPKCSSALHITGAQNVFVDLIFNII